jgi:hypothetical protein
MTIVKTGGTAVDPKKYPIKGIRIKGVPPPAKVLINQLLKLARVKNKMLTKLKWC